MDFDFNNIIGMLRAGVTPDEIAEQFTKNLNTEMDAYNLEQEGSVMDQLCEEYNFENWDLSELFQLLALAWNEAVQKYMEEYHVHLDKTALNCILMDEHNAENLVAKMVDIYSLPVTQHLIAAIPEILDKFNTTTKTVSDKFSKHDSSFSLSQDGLDELVDKFLKSNKH